MNYSTFIKKVTGTAVLVLGLAISPLAMAANPYAKLINSANGTGCTEPLEKSYLVDLAKVTQLPSGRMQVIKMGSLEYYAKTNEAEVIEKCSITNPGDEGSAISVSKLLFRKLWLTMTGKSDVSTVDGIAEMGPDQNIPMIEFRLPSTADVIEISEPLVFGKPAYQYDYKKDDYVFNEYTKIWKNGYVLSITSSPWNSWIAALNTQLQQEQIGKAGEGLVPVSGPLPTIKAAANFKGECGIVLQQDMMLFSGVKLVGFPVGICVEANNVIVDRVEIEGSEVGVSVRGRKYPCYKIASEYNKEKDTWINYYATCGSNNDKGGMLIRSRIANTKVGVSIKGNDYGYYPSSKDHSTATFRVIGNVMTGVETAAKIADHARATVRRNQTGTAVIAHIPDTASSLAIMSTQLPKVSGLEVEDQGTEWAVMGSLENHEKGSAKYLTGDLYAYAPGSTPEVVRWVGRFGCFRSEEGGKMLSNIPEPYLDPNQGVCTNNYNNRIAWVLPKSALSDGDHVFAIVTEGAQPFVASSAIFTSLLGAPFAENNFGYGGSGVQSKVAVVKEKQAEAPKIIPDRFRMERPADQPEIETPRERP